MRINTVRTVSQFSGETTSAVTRRLWREGGARAFFRGIKPTLLKSAPSAAVTFGAYQRLQQWSEGIF